MERVQAQGAALLHMMLLLAESTNCSHDVPALVAFLGCTPLSKIDGSWVLKEIIGVAKDVSYAYGVSHSYSRGNSKMWG